MIRWTPVELYERPATIFAARFVGTPPMNVVPLRALGEAGWLAHSVPRTAADVSDLAVGIRPEAIKIGGDGVEARLVAAEYLGGDSLIEARVGNQRMIVRTQGRMTAAPGAVIMLSWAPDATHWFSLSSGRRIE
jgi:sn-glycerol 3-phosphate transport system ATP-binding protein